MKKTLTLILLMLVCMGCFAGQFSSVPVDHEAYRIIDWASIAGIIPMQTDVKPYNQDKVVKLLTAIAESEMIGIDRRNHIESILAGFSKSSSMDDCTTFGDMISNGYYKRSNEKVSVAVGGSLETTQTLGIENSSSDLVWDSRNTLSAFIKGDLFNAFSYDLNFQILLDKLAPTAFLSTDFRTEADGFYLFHNASSIGKKNNFDLGISSRPEVSTTVLKDTLALRFSSTERDWGVGRNNIIISPTAGAINAVDIDWTPTDWFSYSVMLGSLGKFSIGNGGFNSGKEFDNFSSENPNAVGTLMGVLYPSDSLHDDYYDNNIAAHKAEITFFKNFRFSVWESLIYRTRFELSYLNPLAIYMFEQNKNGDFDNVLAGFDFQFRIRDFGVLYATFGMDEYNPSGNIITSPRNIFAYQAGLKSMIIDRGFGILVAQATYIPAFYGSHYSYDLSESNPWGKTGYSTAYVNKGNSIGYPVNPDTMEFLLSYETNINPTLLTSAMARLQLRSAQYATHATGTNILDTMDYDQFYNGKYKDRDFFGNLWDEKLAIDLGVEKRFSKPSMAVYCNMQFILDRSRDFAPMTKQIYNYRVHNTGTVSWASDWSINYNMNLSLGTHIYL